MHLLKITVGATSAVAMVGAVKWLKKQKSKQRVLVLLSGGNIAPEGTVASLIIFYFICHFWYKFQLFLA